MSHPLVLQEAYKAYERRRLAINERATAAAQSQKGEQKGGFSWGMGSRNNSRNAAQAQQQQQQQAAQPATGEERRIMNLVRVRVILCMFVWMLVCDCLYECGFV